MKYILTAFCFLLSSSLFADESNIDSCNEITKLYKEGDIQGATEEARWCLEALEQMKQDSIGQLFVEKINGWKRTTFENNKAMGMTITNATYSKGKKTVKIAMMSGQSGMAAFSMLAGMQGGKKVRIQRRTAFDLSQGDNAKLMVNLKSGGSLNLESSTISIKSLISFAKKYPIAEIDDANK